MIETTTFQTIYCDIPKCQDRLTRKNEAMFRCAGWTTNLQMFNKTFCLCPFHTEELKDFLFDKEEKANDYQFTTNS